MRLSPENFANRAFPLTIIDALDGTYVAGDTFNLVYASEDEAPPTADFDLIVDSEVIHVASRVGFVCTIGARSAHGSAQADHAANTRVLHGPLAHQLTDVRTQVNARPPQGRKGLWVPEDWGRIFWRDVKGPALTTARHYGDSVMRGFGSTNFRAGSFFGIVDAALKAAYGDGGSGWCSIDNTDLVAGISGQVNATSFPTAGAWTYLNNQGIGGSMLQSVAAGATIDFTNVVGRYFQVAYESAVGLGTFDVIVNGVTVTTINANVAAAERVSQTFDLGAFGNVGQIRIKNNSASGCRIAGIWIYGDTGYSGDNFGKPSAQTTVLTTPQYTGAGAGINYTNGTVALMWPKSPSLVVLAYGINDEHAAMSEDTFIQNLQTFVETVDLWHQTGQYDLLLIAWPSIYYTAATNHYHFMRGMRTVAEEYNAALYVPAALDQAGAGNHQMLTKGWYAQPGTDPHPRDAGHAAFAAPIVELLTQQSFAQLHVAP